MGIENASWTILSRQKGLVSVCNTGEIFIGR